MGRKPMPRELKLLHGNPGKKKIPEGVRVPPRAPTCPRWLLPEAKREWRRIAPGLENLGLLTEIDRASLAAYCQALARAITAERVIAKDGETFETPSGYIQQRPEVAIAVKQWGLVAKFATEFGLTPSSRSRISLPSPAGDEGDDLD